MYSVSSQWIILINSPLKFLPLDKCHSLLDNCKFCPFIEPAVPLIGHQPVISQLGHHHKVHFRGRILKRDEYFARYPGTPLKTTRRGGQPITVIVSSARLDVTVHGCNRLVIALQYKGEEDYHYLIATNRSWCTLDIINA